MQGNFYSPSGRYRLVLNSTEMRMSHWVASPILIDTASGETLLDLDGSLWSVDRYAWADDEAHLVLEMRLYPGRLPGLQLEIDLSERVGRVLEPVQAGPLRLQDLKDWLKRYAQRPAGA